MAQQQVSAGGAIPAPTRQMIPDRGARRNGVLAGAPSDACGVGRGLGGPAAGCQMALRASSARQRSRPPALDFVVTLSRPLSQPEPTAGLSAYAGGADTTISTAAEPATFINFLPNFMSGKSPAGAAALPPSPADRIYYGM